MNTPSTQLARVAQLLNAEQLRLAVEYQTAELTTLYQPDNEYEKNLIEQLGRTCALKEHAANLIAVDRVRSMERAETAWDIDRADHIDKLVGRVHRDMRVAAVLARSRQGAEWLLERWGRLRWPLDANKVWTEAQRSFAFDLLGIEPVLRGGHPVIRPDADVATLKTVVEKEVGRLRRLLEEKLRQSDDCERKAAKVGVSREADSTTKILMTLEEHAWRELQRLKQELHEYRALSAAAVQRESESTPAGPGAAPAPAPAAAAAASDNSPATPAPTPRPVSAADETRALGERWFYDIFMRESAERREAAGPEDEPWDEEPARD